MPEVPLKPPIRSVKSDSGSKGLAPDFPNLQKLALRSRLPAGENAVLHRSRSALCEDRTASKTLPTVRESAESYADC